MKKLSVAVFTAALIALGGINSFAQEKISPQKETLIREFLGLMGSKEDLEKMSSMMMRFQQAESEKMVAAMIDDDKNFTTTDKDELKKMVSESTERIVKRIEEFFSKEMNLSSLLDEITLPLYDKNFTESELRELVAFYKTTTGQKTIKLAPTLMMESMKVFSEKLGPKLHDMLKIVAEDEVTRLKQKLEDSRKSKPLPKT